MTTMLATGVVDDVLLRGRKLTLDIGPALLEATFSVSFTQIGELAIGVYDPSFHILESGMFDVGGSVDFRSYRQEITAVETQAAPDGKGMLLARCRAASIGRLSRRRGPKVMHKASPSEFVIAECKKVGAKYVVQPSARRKSVARDTSKSENTSSGDVKPSSWTTFERFARELGYALFESENTIYFGQPSWLRKRDGKAAVVTWLTGASTDTVGVPRFRDELGPSDAGVSVEFDVPRERLNEFPPGGRVKMAFPRFGEETYLVTGLSFPVLDTGWATVQAGKPVDPKPEPPQKKSTRTGAGSSGGGGPRGSNPAVGGGPPNPTGATGRKSAYDFVTLCLRQAGNAYAFGAEASASDPDPDAFDCSELIEWAAARVGCYVPDGSINQINYVRPISVAQGLATRGAILWIPGHVAVSLGGGTGTIEALNRSYGVVRMGPGRSFSWQRAGLIPGMRY